MAAIDKIYVTSLKQYDEFAEWCKQQPMLTDKYGYSESITKYLYPRPTSDHEYPVFMAPYFVDAYVIRNCPLDYIQDELKINYGSIYDDIKAGKWYTKPTTDEEYVAGKHCTIIKIPDMGGRCNRPYKSKSWWVDLVLPEGMTYMMYHTHGKRKPDTWDFSDEYVIDYKWASSTAHIKTIKALTRLICTKWKLPVGTIVRATGRYIGDDYKILVTK